MSQYPEYKQLDLVRINREVAQWWESNQTFQLSLSTRPADKAFVFYEGPPSANGRPGIHHVMARTIKDIFCRYKTQQGFRVERKSGWDTHGLPIELQVEKSLGITKEDIGKTISVAEYNAACRKDVMAFTHLWEDLTRKMGYWVDLEKPYVTYEKDYIESVWALLKRLYEKDFLYKGYTIQPYSPAAGTGLSSHELNQPGTYKPVKDTTVVALFRILSDNDSKVLERFQSETSPLHAMAWTTTPWTLPSNTALAVGKNINYVVVESRNPYTGEAQRVILAEALLSRYFKPELELQVEDVFPDFDPKNLHWKKIATIKGEELAGLSYAQLLPFAQPEEGDAFRVIVGDFVTTEDGTGIVHIAPSFGADDFRVARQNGIGALTLVDKAGRFTEEVKDADDDLAGEYVKESYLSEEEKKAWCEKHQRDKYLSVDERIAIRLKKKGLAFRVEKYEHNYPHCWRTDKPILYYPLDSWFIRTTAVKDRMVELNKTIRWKPESTGTGRFGNWLENLVDWNLSRSRYWGTPLPIWRTVDGSESRCIGSVEELETGIAAAIKHGLMEKSPFEGREVDLHRPYVDEIVLVSDSGKPMYREPDLIDVWFDSGAMPYAQNHWPFEGNTENGPRQFPADFIAEGVDQTRGWFFTLHAIAVMLFDSVAFKNVVSNGLVLDKFGNKMSKRLGNGIDPFETLDQYGADATRWYMVANAAPWDNLKFDMEGVKEAQRKFFGTLYNTYAFYALYANIDGFRFDEPAIALKDRPEIDRWVISLLNSLIAKVTEAFEEYEPQRAARAIQEFVDEHLSNWYVRLCRRRYWKSDDGRDKDAAYQTLFECLRTLSSLMAPIAPFFAERLYQDLKAGAPTQFEADSVHLATFPQVNEAALDLALEERMALAQTATSLVLSLRKRENIRVRQPLSRILIPVLDSKMQEQLEGVKELILNEVNVKELAFITDTHGLVNKKIKPLFPVLGKKVGGLMKEVAALIQALGQDDIYQLEREGKLMLTHSAGTHELVPEEVEIISEDIPGWMVASEGKLTVALDVSLNEELLSEGLAREVVNRIQKIRKDSGFEVTDRIRVHLNGDDVSTLEALLSKHGAYITSEVLAEELLVLPHLQDGIPLEIEGVNLFATVSVAG